MLSLEIIRSRIGTTSLRNSINRNSPQGEVHYLLLWNIALNSLLVRLYSLDFRTIAYADDVAIAISTAFFQDENGPKNTKLLKTEDEDRIGQFNLSQLKGITLSLTNSAKYYIGSYSRNPKFMHRQ